MRASTTIAAAALLLAARAVRAASPESDHRLLAAQEELKIAKEHLRDADGDYVGHKRAAMESIDRALQEIRQAIDFSRTEGYQPGHHPKPAPEGSKQPPANDPGED
jgi:hypothetical protein